MYHHKYQIQVIRKWSEEELLEDALLLESTVVRLQTRLLGHTLK